MQAVAAFAFGIAVGAACGAVATFVAIDGGYGAARDATALDGRGAASGPQVTAAPDRALSRTDGAQRSGAVPMTPRYRTRDAVVPSASASAPAAAPQRIAAPAARLAPAEAREQIYRCRSASGTIYSNVPCEGGRVVDQGVASGYDSRPSERMAGLIADGRAADARGATANVRALPPSPALPTASGACANMRQQIVDIDAATLRPLPLRELDRLRAVRQDIRTSMSRDHC